MYYDYKTREDRMGTLGVRFFAVLFFIFIWVLVIWTAAQKVEEWVEVNGAEYHD